MYDVARTSNPRICPACDRRVPPRVEQCRCGYTFEAGTEGDPPDSETQPARPWLGPVIVTIVIAAIGSFYMLRAAPPVVVPRNVATAPAPRPLTAPPVARE